MTDPETAELAEMFGVPPAMMAGGFGFTAAGFAALRERAEGVTAPWFSPEGDARGTVALRQLVAGGSSLEPGYVCPPEEWLPILMAAPDAHGAELRARLHALRGTAPLVQHCHEIAKTYRRVVGVPAGHRASWRCSKCHKTGAELADAAGGAPLKHCARCAASYYCSHACQRADWPEHKAFCKQVVRADAAAIAAEIDAVADA
jgi:hypothetical protein